MQVRHQRRHQRRSAGKVGAEQGVLDGQREVTRLLVPLRGPAVRHRGTLAGQQAQLVQQQVTKQRLQPEPLPVFVDAGDE